MDVGTIKRIDIDDEMQQAYLDYAMSVIVSRAIPDARDGLKPVHRRILYAMYDMGLRPDSTFKKSARIVGEVLGKYHPHGDMAVYDAMARMSQLFSMRYKLVDGQGNFGSLDGDPPAAMRYTEARLAAPAIDLLNDLDLDTVDFDINFDDTLTEPVVLPAAIPNLLVNGATGIAVGMSTSIPPHNLGEVVDALINMLENWNRKDDINLEDIMKFIKGPDFPTGGVILQDLDNYNLSKAYGSGRGRIIVQARAHVEEMDRGRHRIIVTALPFMTNKSSLIEKIAKYARDERIDGIVDLRDESDRSGMRIVIELSKTVEPNEVLRDLYKYTPMRGTFSIIMLALVGGEPRLLSLKQALRVYLDHRMEIVRRRSKYKLDNARDRSHILEGYLLALKNLDTVIGIIRKAPRVKTAKKRLMKQLKLSAKQAQAILEMQLRHLVSLERNKIDKEYKRTQTKIKKLSSLLRSSKKMRALIIDELHAVKNAYQDRRRTKIVGVSEGEPKKTLLTASDLVAEKTVWISIDKSGLISRTVENKLPRISGNAAPHHLVRANTRDTVFLLCKNGTAVAVSVHNIPETSKPSLGAPLAKISALSGDDEFAAIFTLPPKNETAEGWYVITVSRMGMVKKSELIDLPGPSADTFTLVRSNKGDEIAYVRVSDGKSDILLATAKGMAIRFSEDDVRPMGLVAAGVMGIKLQEGDEIIGMELLPQSGSVMLITSRGKGKRVKISKFPTQGRYGQGVIAWKLSEKERLAGMTVGKGSERVTLFLDKLAPKVLRLDSAPVQGRMAKGKSVRELKKGDKINKINLPWDIKRPVKNKTRTSKKAR